MTLQYRGLFATTKYLIFAECFIVENIFCYLTISFGEGNGTPLQYSCLENPMDGEAC